MKRQRIFVTGGAGFIGSNFVKYLLRSFPDVQIVVFDKLTYAGNLENLASLYNNPRLLLVPGDICDISAVYTAMNGCKWVVHFAAETHVDRSNLDPNPFARTNIKGTLALLEVAYKLGTERFIHVSTSEVYGNTQAADGISRLSSENDVLKPLSFYAASKAKAEQLAFSYWSTFRLPVVITRCTNNYGPYQYPEKQLPLFIINALAGRPLPVYGHGCHTRDWIHVEDHCMALKTILTAPARHVIGEIFNIGAGEEQSALENAKTVLKLLGLDESHIAFVQDRREHVHCNAVNTSKIHEKLGWAPQISFQRGLEQTIKWYSNHSRWLKHVLARHDTFLERALTLGLTVHKQDACNQIIGTNSLEAVQ
jgi:dTDP-glucose 4,6-dehydratase